MASADPHTVKAFDEDLEQIRALVAQMGGLTEAAIAAATGALASGDEVTAAQTAADDARIDRLSEEVERHCIRLIALRAPMADDLRVILSAFKIAVIVERMGNCARSVAEQVPRTQGFGRRAPLLLLREMSAAAADLVRAALDAFVKQDTDAAARVSQGDDVIAALHDQLFRDLLDIMSESPATITPCTALLLASHKLERIGAHATNIARAVYFATTGEQPPGPRPRQWTGSGLV